MKFDPVNQWVRSRYQQQKSLQAQGNWFNESKKYHDGRYEQIPLRKPLKTVTMIDLFKCLNYFIVEVDANLT